MIESFLKQLDVPDLCKLNKPVFKKLFLENGNLDATDKKALKEDVGKVLWLYTLKPNTINIAKYADEYREYSEVAILQVNLSSMTKVKRIANFIQRTIPYPLLIIFSYDKSICLNMADKRTNQVNKEKWVVEDILTTEWIDLENQTDIQKEFIADFTIKNFTFTHFFAFYTSVQERMIALNCAVHSGKYKLNNTNNNSDRAQYLQELEKLQFKKSELRNRLIKEKQMGKQVELNTQIKNLNDRIDHIKQVI